MADIFKSKYTGEKIEELLDKADGIAVQTGATDDEFDGITIEGKTYHLPQPQDTQEVEANPTDVATEELTKLKVGNTTYSIPENGSSVVANPSTQGTANLERLEVDGVVYDLPQQIEVQANPQGGGDIDLNSIRIGGVNYNIVEPETIAANPLQEATEILSKLQVGSTTYSIPNEGGGGGGSGTQLYKHTFPCKVSMYGQLTEGGYVSILTPSNQPFNIMDGNTYPFVMGFYFGLSISGLEINLPCNFGIFEPAESDPTAIVEIRAITVSDGDVSFTYQTYELADVGEDVVTTL